MALANAPVNAPPPSTIVPQPFDATAADVQDMRSPAPMVALAANEQLFSAFAIATLGSEPPAPEGILAPSEILAPPEVLAPEVLAPLEMPLPLESQAAEPLTSTDPMLPTDPVSPEAAPDFDDGNEIIVTARPRAPKSDPLQELNAESFQVVQSVDEAVVGPIALAYEETLPSPIRSGLSNFLSNLGEPVVFLNYLLQLKPGKAIETLGRFTINTTIGIGGLVDVAKKPPFNLPKRENGFANTLGYYGVKQGAFLFLPLIGPTTIRDMFGRVIDLSVLPFAIGKPFNQLIYTVPSSIIVSLDSRIALDDQIEKLRDSNDPYTETRELYLQQRQAEIDALRGKSPEAP